MKISLSWLLSLALAAPAVNTPPTWQVKEIELGEAYRSTPFHATLPPDAATDEQGDPLRFSLVAGSGPSWLRLSAEGVLSGTPSTKDKGPQQWRISVRDAKGKAGEIPLRLTVADRAPTWKEFTLPEATEEKPFQFNASSFASDPDQDRLLFSKTGGPAWLLVDAKGKISGTAPEGSFGKTDAELEVSDGEKTARTPFTFDVRQKNYAPEIKSDLKYRVAERESFSLELAEFARDRNEKDTLRFSLKSQAGWLSLSETGRFTAQPQFKDIGTHVVEFQVSDSKQSTPGRLSLEVTRNARPPVWSADAIAYSIKSREPFKASITSQAKDPDGLALVFSKASGPEWLIVSPKGELSGTPSDRDQGQRDVTLSVANDRLSSSKIFSFTIEKKNYPPEAGKALELSWKEREVSSVSLLDLQAVKDPDEEKLSFAAKNLPSWITLTPDGQITAKPLFAQIGQHRLSLTARDHEAEVAFSLTVNVVRNARPPEWKEGALSFGFVTREPFQASVANAAKDLDGKPVKFSKVRGPEWIEVSPDGSLKAKPADSAAGTHTLVVKAENDLQGSEKNVTLEVTKKNYPPELLKPFEATWKEREVAQVNLSDAKVVLDRDGERLTYTLKNAPSWITLSAEGELQASPLFAQIGEHHWKVTVKDREAEIELPLNVKVLRNPRPPEWKQEDLVFSFLTREPFQTSIASSVRDLDGKPLQFSKASGPVWAEVTAAGVLKAEAKDDAAGTSTLVVRVQNDGSQSEKRITLKVSKKNYRPELVKAFEASWKEREVIRVSLPDAKVVRDPDGERLTYALKNAPAWVSLSAEGELEARPEFAQIGEHHWKGTAKDQEAEVEFALHIKVIRNPRPPQWKEEDLEFAFVTREPFQASIAAAAHDLDGKPLQFSKVTGPLWLEVTPAGVIKGEAKDDAAGSSTLVVRAQNDGSQSDKRVSMKVTKKNYPPELVKPYEGAWKEREVTRVSLSDAKVVFDRDGERLAYSMKNAPEWVSLSTEGILEARPQFAQIGEYHWKATVKDREAEVEIPLNIKVVRNPRPPEWQAEPLSFSFLTREPFQTSLAKSAKDLDGKPIRFSKVSGPEWAEITADGTLKALAKDEAKGSHTLVARAENDVQGANIQVSLNATKKNYPPAIVGSSWKWTMKERAIGRWRLDQETFTTDPDGDRLTFTAKGNPDWITLSPRGELIAQPAFKQIGSHTFKIEVRDQELTVTADVTLIVERDPRPPVWNSEKLELLAKAREPFRFNLATLARDLDGFPIRFSKQVGPDWLSVTPEGMATAAPEDDKIGRYEVVFNVQNDIKNASVRGTLEVLFRNHPPTWTKPATHLGAVRGGENWSANVASFATDSDPKDKLVFEKVRGPGWIIVSPNGTLFGRAPMHGAGRFEITVRVVDTSREFADWTGTVEVQGSIPRPALKQKSLQLPTGYKGELLVYDFKRSLNDPDFRYRLVKGPPWMTLRLTGELGGIPNEVGNYEFAIEVTNGRETVTFTGKGKISPP